MQALVMQAERESTVGLIIWIMSTIQCSAELSSKSVMQRGWLHCSRPPFTCISKKHDHCIRYFANSNFLLAAPKRKQMCQFRRGKSTVLKSWCHYVHLEFRIHWTCYFARSLFRLALTESLDAEVAVAG
jgi:hypothetical protein